MKYFSPVFGKVLCIKNPIYLLDQSNLDNWHSKYPQIQDVPRLKKYTMPTYMYYVPTYATRIRQASQQQANNTIKNSHSCMMRSAITVGIVFGSLKQVFSLMGWSRSKNSQAQKPILTTSTRLVFPRVEKGPWS